MLTAFSTLDRGPAQDGGPEKPAISALPEEPGEPEKGRRGRFRRRRGQNKPVDLARVAWLVTVGACLIAALVLVLQGYVGYGVVTLAVAASAGVNLT